MPLEHVDAADTRFQFRTEASSAQLRRSLQGQGQQCPVVLWGDSPPFRIVDGFRRVECLRQLGETSVLAVVHSGIDEVAALRLAIVHNAARKQWRAHEKALAAWHAMHERGVARVAVATWLGVSPRQVDRYLALLEFAPSIRKALLEGHLSCAHALVLHRRGIESAGEWVDRIRAQRLSATQLERALGAASGRGRRRAYLRVERDGFTLSQVKCRSSTDDLTKAAMRDALRRALGLLGEAQPEPAARLERSTERRRRVRKLDSPAP